MLPLNVLLTQAKAYLNVIIGTLVTLVVLATGTYIAVLRHERNDARAKVAVLQPVVDGYIAASKALQTRLDAANKALGDEDKASKELIASLQKSAPKNPAQVNAWAIAASKRIAAEAKR